MHAQSNSPLASNRIQRKKLHGNSMRLALRLALLAMAFAQTTGIAQELVADPGFSRGFQVKDKNAPQKIAGLLQAEKSAGAPSWRLVEWYSHSSILAAQAAQLDNGMISWSTPDKSISVCGKCSDGTIVFSVDGQHEYSNQYRHNGDPWPHLLIEQVFNAKNKQGENMSSLAGIKSLVLQMDAKLNFDNSHESSGYNKSIHAAQFGMFLTIHARPTRAGEKDTFLWFGVPIYDSRYDVVSASNHQDKGSARKAGTGKFIYSVGSNDITRDDIHSGKWIHLQGNLLPAIEQAIAAAVQEGYFNKTGSLADYYIGGINMGWEVTGLNTVSLGVRNISLDAN